MLAAAAPYISWLSAAATLAEQTSTQAKTVASAFDAAFAMTVPPPVIAENRAQLLMLIATNILGQNTAAIAATEAAYAEMWAQDAAAMNGYAGLAATAAQLVPFAEPQQNTDQAGLARQQAALAQAAVTAAGTDAPPAPPSLTDIVNTLSSQVKGLLFGPLDVIYWPMVYAGSLIFLQIGALWPAHVAGGAAVGLSATPALAAPAGLGGGLISASLASSTKTGSLSVPTSWYATTPTVAEQSVVHSISAGSGPSNGPETLLRQLVPARGRRDRGGLPPREYGFRPRFIARPPSAG